MAPIQGAGIVSARKPRVSLTLHPGLKNIAPLALNPETSIKIFFEFFLFLAISSIEIQHARQPNYELCIMNYELKNSSIKIQHARQHNYELRIMNYELLNSLREVTKKGCTGCSLFCAI